MSLKAKVEAVIYVSEEPVTLLQLFGLLAEEVRAELDELAARQSYLPWDSDGSQNSGRGVLDAGSDRNTADPFQRNASLGQLEQHADPNTAFREVGSGSPAETEASSPDALSDAKFPQTPTDGQQPPADTEAERRRTREQERAVRDYLRRTLDDLMRDYAESDRGIEVREVAGGFRMGTKPEYHDAARGFIRLLKPALKLSLQALETLAVISYKQPVTAAEISDIRGVDSAGVLGGLIARKLIATAGRKQVIGRPMLYKTTKEFLVRFGLKDIQELPSMEEFERMASELIEQEDLPIDATETVIERANARGDADHIRKANSDTPLTSKEDEETTVQQQSNPEPKPANLPSDSTGDSDKTIESPVEPEPAASRLANSTEFPSTEEAKT